MSDDLILPVATPTRGIPVPGSTVNAELLGYYRSTREVGQVSFYCRESGHRLFDYRMLERQVETLAGWGWERHTQVEKLCPRCKLLNTRPITTQRGVKVGESERWTCRNCGAFLASVDAIRGRLILRCRCGDQRAAVPEALQVVPVPWARLDPDGEIIEEEQTSATAL